MTIKDIARLSGVSVSTVSRVLNEHPDVSEKNRQKVREVIRRSNYIPNNSARDLVRTKSDAIGLVVRGIGNPFYTDIIHAIEKAITGRGYTMVMQQISDSEDELPRGAMMEREKRLLGIIFLGGRYDYTAEDLKLLNVPFVCCAFSNQYGTLQPWEYASVSIADRETAQQVVQRLIDCGHRRIAALISEVEDRSISQLRYQGYIQALEKNGIPFDPELVLCSGVYDIKAAYEVMRIALARGVDFSAVFAISDNMAVGAMRALWDAGRRIPEDCSVIAIDGIELTAYIDPPLTTFCQPMDEMGRCSAEMLLDMIEGRSGKRHETLCAELRKGASVRALR